MLMVMLMLISAMMLGVGDGADDDSDVVGVHEDVDVADDGASLLAPSPPLTHPPPPVVSQKLQPCQRFRGS